MRKNRLFIHPLVYYSIVVFSLLLRDECQAQSTANNTQNVTDAATKDTPIELYGPYYPITNDGIDYNYASDYPAEPYWYPTAQSDYAPDYYAAISASPAGDYPDDVVEWLGASTASYNGRAQTNSDDTGCSNPYYYQSSCTCMSCYSCYCPNEDAAALQSTAGQTSANDNVAASSAASVGQQQTTAASAAALVYEDTGLSEAAIALAVFAAVLMLCLVVAMAVFIFVAVNGKIEVGGYRFQLRGSTPPNMPTGIILVENAAAHKHHHHHHHHRSPEKPTVANQNAAVSHA